MQIGETVTWKEHVRALGADKRVRFTTGVVVGERFRAKCRELLIAVQFISGSPPTNPQVLIWIPEMVVACGRTSPQQHVRKTTPQALIMRKLRHEMGAAVALKSKEIARLRLALNRAGIQI